MLLYFICLQHGPSYSKQLKFITSSDVYYFSQFYGTLGSKLVIKRPIKIPSHLKRVSIQKLQLISQRSVMSHLRCGVVLNDHFHKHINCCCSIRVCQWNSFNNRSKFHETTTEKLSGFLFRTDHHVSVKQDIL